MATTTMTATEDTGQKRDALVERLVESASSTMTLFTIHLGDQLGFYNILAEEGPITASELADRSGTNERYVREWLEQQTVSGLLEVEDDSLGSGDRRFYLPQGHDEVLSHRDSLNYLAPLAQIVAGVVSPISKVVEAFRTGRGVPFSEYGKNAREGQARMNRAMFLTEVGRDWLPTIEDVHQRLLADPPARVADIGCGAGWSSIGIAKSYPNALVDGFDLDEPSIEMARAHVEESGVADRVDFQVRDAGDAELAGKYDLVTAFECIHDMSHPVEALRTMKRLVKDGGAVLVADERVGESFTRSGNEVEGLMYGFSVLHCLPAGMVDQPSAATGTVMRPDTLRKYALEAGFRDVEILPIENFFFRVYRLVP
jgi:2-polyprenyl-3-methyl-5-hydroxy-6-metoxy-1,4-benzoquinol methylase